MNKPIVTANLPAPPAKYALAGSTQFLRWVEIIHAFLADLRRVLANQLNDIVNQLNSQVQGVGDDLDASGGTINPTNPIHGVKGAGVITQINPPQDFSGPIWLLSLDGAWSLGTGGNVAASASPLAGVAVCVVYNPRDKRWYPTL